MDGYFKNFLFITLLITLSASFGCGSSDYGSETNDSFSIEAGGGLSLSGEGAETSPGTTEMNTDVFTAADLPIEAGRQLEFESNMPGTTIDVSFNLEGPWKFVNGAREATLTVSMETASSGLSSEEFPEAVVVARSSWSPSPDMVEYNFQSKDDNGWTAYGRSDDEGRIVRYENASRAMMLPMAVGDSWVDNYTQVEDSRSTDVTAENTVVAKNRLTVPAGSFDAFLLQTKVTAKPRSRPETITWDYTWFVPGIGRAAEIISTPDENREVFGEAIAFYRLKSYR